MINKNKKVKGFSITELIVVIAIAMLMTAVLFSTKNQDSANSEVDSATYQIVAAMRNLQNEALSGKQINSKFASKFIFFYNNVNNTYSAQYNDSGNNILLGPIINKLNSNIQLDSTDSITFTSPFAQIELINPRPYPIAIKVSSKKAAASSLICVYRTGDIEIYKSASVCP